MTNIEAHLRELEEQLLDPAIRKNYEIVSSLLADDFREFGSSGRVFSKEEILVELANEGTNKISLTNFQAKAMAAGVFLVTYRAVRNDTASGSFVTSLRSSIWVMREARWQMLFHQGTKSVDLDIEG
jgi:hypothetical protein